ASGTLPAGLALSASGVLSGTPQVPGTFAITVKVTDSNGCTGTGPTYTLTISCQTITVTNPSSNSGTYNTPLSGSFTFTQSGVGNTQLDGGLPAPATPTVIAAALSSGDSSDVAITYAVVVPPIHGTLTIFNANGSFLYTPNLGNTATDSFTYTATSNGVSVT